MPEAEDARWMRHALSLGARGLGRVWPNPAVGCVLVRSGRVVGRGWTQDGGRPHAEVMALGQAGEAARGATAYVTLEPCAHVGKTPPCADALIAAGVARVVVALQDPDPRTDGGGLARLRHAGLVVQDGVLEADAARAHQGFLTRVMQGRPMVTLKLASSADGRIATATGESQWITGPDARRLVHAQRASHDAVLVGAGTARADDPSLTVRGLGVGHQPVRVVVSRRLDVSPASTLGRTAREVPVWLCHAADAPPEAQEAWAKTGARLIACPAGPGGQLDLKAVLNALGDAGLTRVFCEGGGTLAAGLLAADLVETLVVYQAGLLLGAEGQPAVGAMGVATLSEAPRFTLISQRKVGGDTVCAWQRIVE